jgi:preprotein translocase subunit SecF
MKLVLTKQRSLWWTVSIVLILTGLAAMIVSWFTIHAPLRPSLDFVGGTRIQLERDCTQPQVCAKPIEIEAVRGILSEAGLGSSSIQLLTGAQQSAVSIRTEPLDEQRRSQLETELNAKLGPFDKEKNKIDTVGPTLGKQLLTYGLIALLISFAGITLYMSVRFQFDYAFWAIVALFHDILITIGFFAILGITLGVEVDSLFIVALLTIIGFSVNDTVVIYDRVRENLQLNPDLSIAEIVDIAVNQTLARSINTSLTALLPLVAIFIFGGETLKYFALALIVGFIAGAYSSIFIASTLLVWWRQRTQKSSAALSS